MTAAEQRGLAASGVAGWVEGQLLRLRLGPILILAAAARLAAILAFRNFYHPRLYEWGVIVHNMLAGRGFSYYEVGGHVFPTAFMPPAYAGFLYLLFRVFGEGSVASYAIGELVGAAAGVMLVYLVYRIAENYWSRPLALLSALLAALYPAFIYMTTQMSPINLYIIVDAALFLCLSRYLESSPRKSYLAAAGLLAGVYTLFRAEGLGLVVLLGGVLLWRARGRHPLRAAAFVALALVVVAPWTIRNLRTFHKWLPVTTAGPVVLWLGHNPDATGSMWHGPPDFRPIQMSAAFKEQVAKLPLTPQYEIELHHLFLVRALRFMRTHPKREAVLFAKKFLYDWTFDPHYRRAWHPEYYVPALMLMGFFLIGALGEWRQLASRYLLFTVYVVFTMGLGTVFYVLPRYRTGIVPFLLPFAALGFLHACRRVSTSRAARPHPELSPEH